MSILVTGITTGIRIKSVYVSIGIEIRELSLRGKRRAMVIIENMN